MARQLGFDVNELVGMRPRIHVRGRSRRCIAGDLDWTECTARLSDRKQLGLRNSGDSVNSYDAMSQRDAGMSAGLDFEKLPRQVCSALQRPWRSELFCAAGPSRRSTSRIKSVNST